MPIEPPIRFYFDYISHNAYIAWHALLPIAERFAREVDPVPVLFAGLLDAHGNVGPAEVPAKARWMVRDVARKALSLGVPLSPPASHPFRPLLPLRVTGGIAEPEARREVTSALFAATWAESRDVSEARVVADVLRACGRNAAADLRAAEGEAAKRQLREQTEAAVREGVFGVPSMVVDGRLFWGYDDLRNLELYLAGEDPLEEIDLPSWDHVRPSARRRREL